MSGQNKNHPVIWYLIWRALREDKSTVKFLLNFMLTGHTKFSPDRHFGDVTIRSRDVRTLMEMEAAVNDAGGKNVAQLTWDHNGNVIVPVYDWKTYFEVQ